MRKLLVGIVGVFLSISMMARAESETYEFIQKYNVKKSQLKHLPEKTIAATPYCARMDLMIDQAAPADLVPGLVADRIVVSKTRRKLYLLNHGRLMHSYDVAFGFGSLEGPKSQAGDGRTPEGIYEIDIKKKNSSYHQALHVSYPNEADQKFAAAHHVATGGSIMIHGMPNQFSAQGQRIDEMDGLDPFFIPQIHPRADWTQGCIGLSNSEIEEVFTLVPEHTAVEICPLESRREISEPTAADVSQVISSNSSANDEDQLPPETPSDATSDDIQP